MVLIKVGRSASALGEAILVKVENVSYKQISIIDLTYLMDT